MRISDWSSDVCSSDLVATGQDLADEVRWVKFSALDWAKDGSGFYYSRFPEPEAGEAFQSLNENHSVYFHKLATPKSEDVLIHATPDKPKLNNSAVVTTDGEYLLVVSYEGNDERYRSGKSMVGKEVVSW